MYEKRLRKNIAEAVKFHAKWTARMTIIVVWFAPVATVAPRPLQIGVCLLMSAICIVVRLCAEAKIESLIEDMEDDDYE